MTKVSEWGDGVDGGAPDDAGRRHPPEVYALLLSVSRALAFQLAAAPPGPVAALVTAPRVWWPSEHVPHAAPHGARCAVVPEPAARAVAEYLAPATVRQFEERQAPGMLWCLVLWQQRGVERASLVSMRPLAVTARGTV